MTNVLIQGSTGFLGSHLCEELLARGFRVLAADGDRGGHPRHLAHLMGHPRFAYLRGAPTPPAVPVDEIYAFTGPFPPDPGAPEALPSLAAPTGARLLRAHAAGITLDPLPWTCPQPDPEPCRSARLINGYGPRMADGEGGLLSRMIAQALDGEPVRVPGTGTRTLALCFVDDLVRGLIALMAAPAPWEGPVDLGSPVGVPVLDLARMIIRLARTDSGIFLEPEAPQPPAPAPLRTARGWTPQVPLEIGLQRTLDYQRWLREQPVWLPGLEPARGGP